MTNLKVGKKIFMALLGLFLTEPPKKSSRKGIKPSKQTNYHWDLHFLGPFEYQITLSNLSDALTSILTLGTSPLASLFTATILAIDDSHSTEA